MQEYDDFMLSPQNFDIMAKEFNVKQKANVLNIQSSSIDKDNVKNLFSKIEFLKVLINNLKSMTKNRDILLVLEEILNDIKSQNNILLEIFQDSISVLSIEEETFKMFCNNLKIAIQTTSDIVSLLIKIKDDDTSFELSPKLTQSINSFLTINNQFVSLFGECRYLRFEK